MTFARYLVLYSFLLFFGGFEKVSFAQGVSPFRDLKPVGLGFVYDSKPLNHKLTLKNNGNSTVSEFAILTSCGCTTVTASRSTLDPGDTVDIAIEVDTLGKRGEIEKVFDVRFVYENQQHEEQYRILFNVIADLDAHKGRNIADKLFGEDCGECHYKPAAGKFGKKLFVAVCGYCHGKNAQGAMAKGFTRLKYLRDFNRTKAIRIISKGDDDNLMPGFSKENGGPLNARQIESLVDYFERLRDEWIK